MNEMGFSLGQTTWTFSLAILFLGFSAGLLGSFVEKIGPKKSGLIAMTFFGTGMLGTAYAISVQSLMLLYLFYGVIGGIGLGVGYITPVSTLVKYFPDRRGFATGLAIMGFGFAALIAGPVMQYLTATVGLVNNFLILGCIYMAIMGASALYLRPPVMKDSQGRVTHVQRGVTANEALKTWQFASLWWVFFVNITCGIGLLAVASPMAQEVIGMDAAAAASMVASSVSSMAAAASSGRRSRIISAVGASTCCSSCSKSQRSGSSARREKPWSLRSSCCSSSAATAAVSRACRPIFPISSAHAS